MDTAMVAATNLSLCLTSLGLNYLMEPTIKDGKKKLCLKIT